MQCSQNLDLKLRSADPLFLSDFTCKLVASHKLLKPSEHQTKGSHNKTYIMRQSLTNIVTFNLRMLFFFLLYVILFSF